MSRIKSKEKVYRTKEGTRVRILSPEVCFLGVKVARIKDGYAFYADPNHLSLSK